MQAATLDDGQQSFWQVLEGNDTIIGPNNGSIAAMLFGDGFGAKNGGVGGNDTFVIGNTQSWVAGDVWNAGTQTKGGATVTYKGGNDVIDGTSADWSQVMVGDVAYVYATGDVTGGNDVITKQTTGIGTVVGDALFVEGVAGDIATVTGGNDRLIAGQDALRTEFVGDVAIQKAFSFVRGGHDVIVGGAGFEDISGDVSNVGDGKMVGGNDRMWGGDDDDNIVGDFWAIGSLGEAIGGNDVMYGGNGDDNLFGDGGSDNGKVTGGNDQLYGEAGRDDLYGGGGDDLLDGGKDFDYMHGGTGNDTFVVDHAQDAVVENVAQGIDTVQTTLSTYTLGDNVENLTYTGNGTFGAFGNTVNNVIKGGAGVDTIVGLSGNDRLFGSVGADLLYGDADNDVLNGGTGGDLLDGGAGFDTASYAGSEQAVKIALDGSLTATGDAVGDSLTSIEGLEGTSFGDTLIGNILNNWLSGGDGNDLMYGQAGNDQLLGGNGNDQINGGFGNDTLTGGAGVDTFVLSVTPVAGNADKITDMTTSDFIRLSKAAFSAIGDTLTANEFRVNTTGVAGDADDRIIYESDTGNLYYDTNGSAAGGAVQIATLNGAPAITFADFQLM